jgi:hypothetical protein
MRAKIDSVTQLYTCNPNAVCTGPVIVVNGAEQVTDVTAPTVVGKSIGFVNLTV